MMMSSNDVDHTKVPIWVGKDCKLVSGINKSTTCQNVIQSLITDNPSKFVIVEKWKKMERRLDGSVRILKVWKAWGDQKDDVALILRPHHANDGYIDKRISNKVLRRNKSSQLHKQLTNHDSEKMMEEVEMKGGGTGGKGEPMERLLKLVLTQGETIQAQLKKLRHQEEQIERYEEEMHRIRSLKEGDNYVVESYLRDDKGKKFIKKNHRDKSPRKSAGWLKQQLLLHNHHNHHHHQHHHQHQQQQHHNRQNHSRDNHHQSSNSSSNNNNNNSKNGEKNLDLCHSSSNSRGGHNANVNGNGNSDNDNGPTGSGSTVQKMSDEMKNSSANNDNDPNGNEENDHEEYMLPEIELMERICELNHKLTKEEETLVKLGLKIKKFYERHKDNDRRDCHEESKRGNNNDVNEGDNVNNKEDTKINISQQAEKEEEEEQQELLRQLTGEVELLREDTSEQFSEIALNEKSLNELEQILDSKHDHVAHLTYQIQLVDEESEYLRQRLLKISQGFPPRSPYPSTIPPTPHHHYNLSSMDPTLQQNQSQPIITATSSSSSASPSSSEEEEMMRRGIIVLDKTLSLPPIKIIGSTTTNTTTIANTTTNQQIISCDSSPINFQCSQDPTTTMMTMTSSTSNNATGSNLHMKNPCRDHHQDNDSNSDTGISSLHSSSDEHTFVLDTLV